jgi:hypothetical protein
VTGTGSAAAAAAAAAAVAAAVAAAAAAQAFLEALLLDVASAAAASRLFTGWHTMSQLLDSSHPATHNQSVLRFHPPSCSPLSFPELGFGPSEAAVRINPVSSGLAEDDLSAVLSAKRLPDALVVPKVESQDEVRLARKAITNISIKQNKNKKYIIIKI